MTGSDMEKKSIHGDEEKMQHDFIEQSALAGHVATDSKGHSLITFDPAAEAKLRRKIDMRIMPIVMLMYLWCFIDRANIGNANIAGLPKDLGLTGYMYNELLTAFYVAYVVFEPGMVMVVKYYGPGRVLPACCFFFGLFAFLTGFVTEFGGAFTVRFLLGIAESAMLPGIAFYLSRWYRKDELTFRLAGYIVCAPLAGAFGGLLASAILTLPGFGFITTWRLIFFIEGLITMGVGVLAYFTLTDRPDSASWLSEDEKALAIARVKSENVGATVVIDKLSTRAFIKSAFQPSTLGISFIFLLNNITVQGLGFFLPTIIKSIYPTKTTIQLQLQTVPPYIVGAFFTLFIPYLSYRTGKKGMWMLVSAPMIVASYAMFVASTNSSVRFAAVFLGMMGAFPFGSLCNAWAAANQTSDTGRASAIAIVTAGGNLGGLIATWSYLPFQAPNYYPGNSLNLATGSMIFCTAGLLIFYMDRQNKAKARGDHDHRLEGLSVEEVEQLGQAHPGFTFSL